MRKGPGLDFEVIMLLNRNEDVIRKGLSIDGYWYYIEVPGKGFGWVSSKFLEEIDDVLSVDEYPWYSIAKEEMGESEQPGASHNPRIVEYLHSTNLGEPLNQQDETAWCSAFANWCVEKAGFEGTDSAWARDWLLWGKELLSPIEGCIVVFSRGDGGHVGFFVRQENDKIVVLGGNQHNKVCIAEYPKSRLLGFREI